MRNIDLDIEWDVDIVIDVDIWLHEGIYPKANRLP